jgi:predicted RNA-binding Zn-ribbon protein involved in translation (DUF1610 family)
MKWEKGKTTELGGGRLLTEFDLVEEPCPACDHIVGICYDYGGNSLINESELEGNFLKWADIFAESFDSFSYCPECGEKLEKP